MQGSGRITTAGANAPGILLSATGGNGAGGRGAPFFGTAGHGGAGGVGSGGVLLSAFPGDWTIATTASGAAFNVNSPGVRIQVAGGNGGNGGDSSGLAAGRGGDGGDGVASGNGIVIGPSGSGAFTITTQGGGSDGVQVSARGGNGGTASSQDSARALRVGAGVTADRSLRGVSAASSPPARSATTPRVCAWRRLVATEATVEAAASAPEAAAARVAVAAPSRWAERTSLRS